MGFVADSFVTPEQNHDIQTILLIYETGWTWEYARSLPISILGKFAGFRTGKAKAGVEGS